MIHPDFLNLLFSTASIERWNDQIRPVDFVELDKQAHKMITAWLLGRIEERENRTTLDWDRLVGFALAEFAYRAVVTDLKPPVFHYLTKHNKEKMDTYVLRHLEPIIDENFKAVLTAYMASDENEPERRILGTAHFLASRWEFSIIYDFRPNAYGVEEIRQKIESEMEEYLDLTGVGRLELGKKSRNFLELCAMLRFQKRWAKTPRVPQISVLGHMMFVATVTWLLSTAYGACRKKRLNNFFAALFHDTAEALTRDIISPVKYGVEGLEELLADYEKKLVEEKLLPLLPSYLREELHYYITDEFADKVIMDGRRKIVEDPEKMATVYNRDDYDGIDGSLVKVADELGAFMEAAASIQNGVAPDNLKRAERALLEKYRNKELYGLKLGKLFEKLAGTG